MGKPGCFGTELHDPKHPKCKTCALFLSCAVAASHRPPGTLAGIGHIERSPRERVNRYVPGTCRWAAHEAVNRLDAEFSERDVLSLYVGICHQCGIDPGSAERNIRCVVTQLVTQGALIRSRKQRLIHAD